MKYFDLYPFIGKDLEPPGGVDLIREFMNELYFSEFPGRFRYLEVASHTGTLGRAIASLDVHDEIIGVDVAKIAIDRANYLVKRDGLKRIHYVVANAEDLPFDDESFDFVDLGIAFGFFIQNREKCLQECRRVLKPNGRIFINNLFYTEFPPSDLIFDMEKVLEIKLDQGCDYDYSFHYNYLSDFLDLEKELVLEFEGRFSKLEFANYIRKLISHSDAEVAKLSEEEQEQIVEAYAEGRYVLHKNEKYCQSALQSWKLK